MNNKVTVALLITVLSFFSALSHAAPLINGVAIHSELGQERFIGALMSTTLSSNAKEILVANEEKEIQVRVVANRISARRFKRAWIEGMAVNASSKQLSSQSKNMADFSNLLKITLVKGDIFSIQRKESVIVSLNGARLGEIDDPRFFDFILRTWIGPVPLSSDYRDNLLKAGDVDDALLTRFNAIKPSDERITTIANALVKKAEADASAVAGAAATTAAVAAAKPEIKAPVAAPKIAAPTISKPKATEKPKAVAKATPTPKPSKKPVVVAAAPKPTPEPEPVIDDIFEEDDEDFTAESLLTQQLYIAKLKKWTYKKLVYPERSLDRGEEGMVRLSVTINRKGKVDDIQVIEEPEFKRLTKAALTAVKKSAPYPAIPDDISDKTFTFTLPIFFNIVEI